MIRTTLILGVIGTVLTTTGVQSSTPGLIIVAILFCSSAFFSGSETALFSLQPLDRKAMDERDRERVERLLRKPRSTLASILIGNEVTNVTLATVTAGLLFAHSPDKPWLNVLVLTPLLLVFGEVLPKVIALRFNRRLAPKIATLIVGFSRVVAPFRWALGGFTDAVLTATSGSIARENAELREAHLRALIDQGHRTGSIAPIEQEMLHKVFDFGDLTVNRLMTPRPDVFTLRMGLPWTELLARLRAAGFSRVPMWMGKPDNYVGILVVKELLPVIAAVRDGARPPTTREFKALLHRPRFVPTTKKTEEMLLEFRTERYHMATVVDEHGTVVGLVTLEDLLSELVGEMFDEVERDKPDVKSLAEGVYAIRASMTTDDFARQFDVELPNGDYTTIGGFLLSELGEVPTKGAELQWEGLHFTVAELDGLRMTGLCLRTGEEHTLQADPLATEERVH